MTDVKEYVPGKLASYWLEIIASEGGETSVPNFYRGLPLGWAMYSLINNGFVEICGLEAGATKYRLRAKGRKYMAENHGWAPSQDEPLF